MLRAKFRGYRRSEMLFSCLHVKIWCLEPIWVPSAHRNKSGTYPLKSRSKIFQFSTMKFLGIFADICLFFGLFNWFRAKTTWETHPTEFWSTKNRISGFLNFFFWKSIVYQKNFLQFFNDFSRFFSKNQESFFLGSKIKLDVFPKWFKLKTYWKTKKMGEFRQKYPKIL